MACQRLARGCIPRRLHIFIIHLPSSFIYFLPSSFSLESGLAALCIPDISSVACQRDGRGGHALVCHCPESVIRRLLERVPCLSGCEGLLHTVPNYSSCRPLFSPPRVASNPNLPRTCLAGQPDFQVVLLLLPAFTDTPVNRSSPTTK